MKTSKIICTTLLLVWALFCGETWARPHGGHGGHAVVSGGHVWRGHHPGFGFYFGSPFYSYPFYPYSYYPYSYPYYYPPTVVTVPTTPPVYIQQSPPVAQEYPSGYWYYCNNPEGYYPYVKECSSGWQQVEPTPPAPR